MKLFDTHAHYDDGRFDSDREELLSSALAKGGVRLVVNPGCDVPSSHDAVKLAETYEGVYAAVGIHPENLQDVTDADFDEIRRLCALPKVIAIGEIGLDYYWEKDPVAREFQKETLRRQLSMAQELDMPVIIHDREAHGDCMEIIREYSGIRGVFHCYSGSPEMAKELLKLGWYLGFDGPITYKNNGKAPEVAAVTPVDRILLETDSPYLSPVPLRGRRNDSRNLIHIAEKLAEWKGMTPDELAEAAYENGCRLFGISC